MAVSPSSVTSKASGIMRIVGWFKPLFVHLKNSSAVLLTLGLVIYTYLVSDSISYTLLKY